MKLAKSLLLGSAAGLVAVASASAADLPVRKAAPVDYVRVCSAYGTGFFYIPGTDTCLRVSGFVRADYTLNATQTRAGATRNQQTTNFFARGRLNLDSRTGTEFGLLRTFTSLDFNANQGGADALNVVNAYIQWGGLTAGRIASFFNYRWGNGTNVQGLASTSLSYGAQNVLAYTASFGQGVSATISLETPNGLRRNPGIFGAGYAGHQVPDIVANLDVDQSWGGARLAVAAHQLKGTTVAGRNFDQFGWAVLGGVEFNLPQLGSGSSLWVQGTYADGAASYAIQGTAITTNHFSNAIRNAYVNPTGGITTTKTYGVAAGLTHRWNPQFASLIQANYGRHEVPQFARMTTAGAAGAVNNTFDYWGLGHTLQWTPVSGLNFWVDTAYRQVQQRGRVVDNNGISRRNSDHWAARLRIQRAF